MDYQHKKNYARLIARMGLNVQKGQEIDITCDVEQVDFIRILAEELYLAGASKVNYNWTDASLTRLDIQYALEERISHLTSFEKAKQEYNIEKHPCRLFIESEDTDALKGVDQVRYGKIIASKNKEIRKYRDQYDDYCQWCIAGVPSKAWAKKVFPDLEEEEAIEALWVAILKVSRAYEGDPIENWKQHDENLNKHTAYLNSLNLRKLHYYSKNGTDFTVELLPDVLWLAGGENTKGTNVRYQPNIPTEECFTTPDRLKTNGIVYATKPLSYRGEIIEDFHIRFENGRAVEIHARKGEELLKDMVQLDENACYLGECALVPFHSPINDTGILFFSTLYDENASCHLALGRGFNMLLKNPDLYKDNDEILAHGINQSIVHTDFMIGSEDLNIDGFDENGKLYPIFRNGNWA